MADYFGNGGHFRLNKGLSGKTPFGNPLANALVVLAGILLFVALLVVGFLAFVAISGLFVVLLATLGVRSWWRNRRFLRGDDESSAAAPNQGNAATHVIEGEFRDVSTQEDRESKRGG